MTKKEKQKGKAQGQKEKTQEQKKKTKQGKIAATMLMVLLLFGILLVLVLYHRMVVPRGYVWLYSWIEMALIGLAVFLASLAAILWIPAMGRTKVFLIMICGLLCLLGAAAANRASDIEVFTERSPDGKHLLVLEIGEESQTVTVDRVYRGIFRREREKLPFTRKEEIKTQWLENDVCAITYESPDGQVYQYLETFGDRGDGISYLDPLTAVMGHWTPEDASHGGCQLTIEGGTVRLQNGAEEWLFQNSDCVRYGTTGLVLCEDGLPKWSLVMNEDCVINYDSLIAEGGTLTLCEVSMEKTDPLTFVCTDSKEAYSETNPNLQTAEELEAEVEAGEAQTFERMRSYAAGEAQWGAAAEGQMGILYVEAMGEDEAWNIRNALQTYYEGFRINGIDVRVQLDTVQRLAGDAGDGLYEVIFTELCISPGNQGAGPEGESEQLTWKLRLMKAAAIEEEGEPGEAENGEAENGEAGGYAYVCNFREAGTDGLSGGAGEQLTLSNDPDYHFFLAGEYDTTYMYVSRRTPEEGMEAVYSESLSEQYPGAAAGVFAGMPYMDLSGDGQKLLLYDGISEDLEHYVYQMATIEEKELTTGSRMHVEETYQTAIRE